MNFCLDCGPLGSDAVRTLGGLVLSWLGLSSGIELLDSTDVGGVGRACVRIVSGCGLFSDWLIDAAARWPVVPELRRDIFRPLSRLDLGLSPSGGGVGGNTFLLIVGGALCSLPLLWLIRFLFTKFVAA